jgi:ABC-type enterochelin transport system ATPase subunit
MTPNFHISIRANKKEVRTMKLKNIREKTVEKLSGGCRMKLSYLEIVIISIINNYGLTCK